MTDDRAKEFGNLLLKARQQADLSQAALAERAGTKSSTLSTWEQGLCEPSPDAVFSLEAALGLRGGVLSQYLGYVPKDAENVSTVEEAIRMDPTLNAYRRQLLLQLYETLRGNE